MVAVWLSGRDRLIRGGLLLALLCVAGALAAERFADSFEHGLDQFQLVGSDTWRIATDDAGNAYLELPKPGKLRPGVRRPGAYVLVKDRRWQDVTITLRAKSLRPSTVKGRDVVVVFGWQDDTHFYYTHLSNDSNNKTHNVIVKVVGDHRTPLQLEQKPEPRLSDGWHTLRVTHQSAGTIRVYVDDLEAPLMTAQDADYSAGAVGCGTFDDPAAFDDLVVEGTLSPEG